MNSGTNTVVNEGTNAAVNAGAVNAGALSSVVDDELWSAIGDPTRRRMLDLLLAEGQGTATTLSAHLPVTRQAVTKHLIVLDRVGLVHVSMAGREKRYLVDQTQLARAVAQLNSVGILWDARLRRIASLAEAIQIAKKKATAENGSAENRSAENRSAENRSAENATTETNEEH